MSSSRHSSQDEYLRLTNMNNNKQPLSREQLRTARINKPLFDVSTLPPEKSRWKHHTGYLCDVIMVTNIYTIDLKSVPVTVVYVTDDGRKWSMPFDVWRVHMTRVHRFEKGVNVKESPRGAGTITEIDEVGIPLVNGARVSWLITEEGYLWDPLKRHPSNPAAAKKP